MKKLILPTLALSALIIGVGCDMNKKTSKSSVMDTDGSQAIATDTVRTKAASPSNYGVSAGSAAMGNAHYKRTAHPVVTETDEIIILEEPDYSEIDRQAMEESEYNSSYPAEEFESEEARLNRLQKENGIFYGYPSATGSSGAPGTYDLNK